MIKFGQVLVPENETPLHWSLKWIGWYILRDYFRCYEASGVEVSVHLAGEHGGTYARQDAVGLRHEYAYRKEPTLLVHPDRLTGWSPELRKKVPWSETVASRRQKDGKVARWCQSYGVTLDNTQSVDIINPKPNKAGEVRVQSRHTTRITHRLVYGVDAKQSRSDYQKWRENWQERVAALDYAIIITPKDLLKAADLPPKIGLVEVDPKDCLVSDIRYRSQTETWKRLNYRVAVEPKRLRKPRRITDEAWYKLQADCWSGMAAIFERNLHDIWWHGIAEALKAE